MNVEYGMIFAYIIGIILLYFLGRLLIVPLKMLMKAVFNTTLGGILLLIINYVGSMVQFHIPFNLVSALMAGILGIPGVALLIIMKYVFNG